MSELGAAILTAIATAVLAFFAIVTAIVAFLAFRKQSREVRAIEQQLQLQRHQAGQEQAERRRAQASLVFMTIEPRPFDGNPEEMRDAACVYNSSRQPVYDVLLVLDSTAEPPRPVLLPGKTHVYSSLGTAFTTGQRPIWITFQDSAGIRWLRRPDGQLDEQE